MIDRTGQPKYDGLAEDNCRIDQLTAGFLDNIQLCGNHRSHGREAAKFAELIVLNEVIFGSAHQAVQEQVEIRAQRKFRLGKTGE